MSSPAPLITAYVQSDWSYAEASPENTAMHIKNYQEFLGQLSAAGIKNVATWHQQGTGAQYLPNQKGEPKSTDVLRNTREIDAAQSVITVLHHPNPEMRHWGSLFLMGYAMGQGKPCFLVAPEDNVVWKHHGVWDPRIQRFHTVEEMLAAIRN